MNHKTIPMYQRRALILFMGVGLIISQVSFSTVKLTCNSKFETKKKDLSKKNKPTGKTYASRNNRSVKIYPDALKKTVHIIARKNYGKSIDFFVFDLEGTLIQNYKMRSRDHMKISGLKRGSYVFRVFSGDEETASGNFEIL